MSKGVHMRVDARGTRANHSAGDHCPACSSSDVGPVGKLTVRTGIFGKFLGCSRFPKCKYTKKVSGRKKKKNETMKDVIREQRFRMRSFPKDIMVSVDI